MADNIQRNRGRGSGYKFNRGGIPTEFGPFIGIVVNNIDPTRSGRLQVWIEQFGASNPDGSPNLDDESVWRTVNYVPPFYGTTPHSGTDAGAGTFTGNQQSYGMWFTPPDLFTQVMCFFAGGDPNQGYYIGCVQDPGIQHMIPAIGASRRFTLANGPQDAYFAGASQLPVTEINAENQEVTENPRFFDQPKPVHSYVAGIMMQQGLIRDTVRGPITSNAQRESPSAVFGISTPGKPIYQGGLNELDIKNQLERGQIRPQDIEVIARRGGHTVVMDDGDLEGRDALVRIRTAKGHQITMSDDGDCFYIIHANGQTWLEFGKQGTVDVFSTNSVNVRTQGTINLHADKDINMYAGGSVNVKTTKMTLEAENEMNLIGTGKISVYSKNLIGIKSDGSLNLKNSTAGSWDAGGSLTLKAGCISLNSGGGAPVDTPTSLKDLSLADTKFIEGTGWTVEFGTLKSIVTRAPTHEPYPYHNQGVSTLTEISPTPEMDLTEATAETLEQLDETVVENGIDDAAYLEQQEAEISVGSLDTTQVTGLMAQAAQDTGQDYDEISLDKGIGRYGLSAQQLESSGFLKPGTVQTYLKDPAQLESVLSSPSVWTGKSGVSDLGQLLGDSNLQNLTQNEIMVSSLQGLKTAGLVTGNENPKDLGTLVQVASKFGVGTTESWIKGVAPSDIASQINTTAKNAQFSLDFVNNRLGDVGGGLRLGGFTNTVERGSLDRAVQDIIGDAKIPSPDYSTGLFSNVPSQDLSYDPAADSDTQQRINQEREQRGLPPIVDQTTGSGETVRVSSATTPVAQNILRLETEIADLEATIRFRQRRDMDITSDITRLAQLQAELQRLRQA